MSMVEQLSVVNTPQTPPILPFFYILTTPHATFNPRIVLSGHIECLHLVTSCVAFALGFVVGKTWVLRVSEI